MSDIPNPDRGKDDDAVAARLTSLAQGIDTKLPPGWGFFLTVFPFSSAGSRAQTVSNGDREQCINAMREIVARYDKAKTN